MGNRPLLAHSGVPDKGIPPQLYSEHVNNMVARGRQHAQTVGKYAPRWASLLEEVVVLGILRHDLGKCDLLNQDELYRVSEGGERKKNLPVLHVDAGVYSLMRDYQETKDKKYVIAAALVYAHHPYEPYYGLADCRTQWLDCKKNLINLFADEQTRPRTLEAFPDYLRSLSAERLEIDIPKIAEFISPDSIFYRMALSCLVEADRFDTSQHYQASPLIEPPLLLPDKRLQRLDEYVASLNKNQRKNKRNKLRREIYECCRNHWTIRRSNKSGITCASFPVGGGKTTAILAYALQLARVYNLQHIITVIPYTSTIDQTTRVYRGYEDIDGNYHQGAIILNGEIPHEVAVAHHHRVSFERPEYERYSVSWTPPFIVTTGVQFWETAANNNPTSIEKYRNIAGSAIILDDVQACLPPELWPLALKFMQTLVKDWGCKFILASGTLAEFWKLEEFIAPIEKDIGVNKLHFTNLNKKKISKEAIKQENRRISYIPNKQPMILDNFVDWLLTEEHWPKLIVLNTVQIAAVVAQRLATEITRANVDHLSTALAPKHRENTIERVQKHLLSIKCETMSNHYILVATSCSECGMNFDFRDGFRQRCSHSSLTQTGGRVNRENRYAFAPVYDFDLVRGGLINYHPDFIQSADVLSGMLDEGLVGPEHCTEAMRRLIGRNHMAHIAKILADNDRIMEFKKVRDDFRVIHANTVTCLIDSEIIYRLERSLQDHSFADKPNDNEIMMHSVQIWSTNILRWGLQPIEGMEPNPDGSFDMYKWMLPYDGFLGYMAGALELLQAQHPDISFL